MSKYYILFQRPYIENAKWDYTISMHTSETDMTPQQILDAMHSDVIMDNEHEYKLVEVIWEN